MRGPAGSGIVAAAGLGRRRDGVAAYARAYRKANLEKSREYARAYHAKRKGEPAYNNMKRQAGTWVRRKRKYGITREEYVRALTLQRGRCYICGEFFGEALRVDHDHKTGKVRKLLCNNCNTGLGSFKEDPIRLNRAIEYLNEHHGKIEKET